MQFKNMYLDLNFDNIYISYMIAVSKDLTDQAF